MVSDQQYHYSTALRQSWFGYVVSRAEHIAYAPVRGYMWLTAYTRGHTQLVEKNIELQRKEQLLQAKLLRHQELIQENARLRNLAALSDTYNKETMVIATMITASLDPFRHIISIDKGARDNIRAGLPVLNNQGLIGQVVSAGHDTSSIILITDPLHATPVQVERNGVRAVASGTGSYDHLLLDYILPSRDIAVGDRLITSGLGGRFPYGYPVGEVESVLRTPQDTFVKVRVRPYVLLDRQREMLVLKSLPPKKLPKTQKEIPAAR